ncbi:MAG: MoaD/ThiS family protein [Gammaproteobacteria bacterium]|nr:MoaD/ThiS family protein [Gammaproteobacteria bacterium]
MATVIFSSELQKFTREEQTDVDVLNYRDLVSALEDKYQDLGSDTLMKMAVAIDGEIIHDPLLERLAPDSEVHFLYRISGG